MQQNPFTFLDQAISQLLATNIPTLEATGLDIFRGLAVILIVWFGIKSALSGAQGHGGGFHFAKFADLILMISFGLGMLTYYSTPIPGVGRDAGRGLRRHRLRLRRRRRLHFGRPHFYSVVHRAPA